MGKEKKRADGRYQKSVTVGHKNGKPIRKSVYGRTRNELDANYIKLKSALSDGYTVGDSTTVKSLLDAYCKTEKTHLREKSKYDLQGQVRVICTHIGDIKLRDLTEADIDNMKAAMIETPVFFNRALGVLRSALRYAVNHKMVRRNVAEAVEKYKVKQKKKRALTDDEIFAIKAAKLPPQDRALIDVLLYTGVRIGEALALTTADVDLESKKLIVNKSVHGETKTAAGVRVITMPSPLVSTLTEYLRGHGDGLLFTTSTGRQIAANGIYRRWARIMRDIFGEDAPKDITPHLFRHNYASDLYKAGVGLKAAQLLLGHEDIKTTLDIYTHFSADDVDISPLENLYKKREDKISAVKM